MGDETALDETFDAGGAVPEGQLAIGARLGGRYRVTRFLGQGGMGAVYLAFDEALDKEVALKLVTVGASGDALARLRDEVRLAQQVTHPMVCRTYDLEEVDGRWLVKMEYVPGETLAKRLAEGRLAITVALAIARQIAAGLAAAHARGIVHRDLKPQNIQLEAGTDRAVLMDFGIARPTELAGSTAEGVIGTPAYMAPEQALGREVDARADVYALGCVLYEMLIGAMVFPSKTPMEVALRHQSEAPPDPRRARAEIPAWLSDAILRMLAKPPAPRPADGAAVLTQLAGPKRRWPWIVVALAVVAAIAVGVIVVRRRAAPAEPTWQPEIRELQAYEENSDAAALSPDGTQVAYPSDRDRPGWTRIYVESVDGGPARALTPADWNAAFPRWTDDGQALVFNRGNSVVRMSISDPQTIAVVGPAAAPGDVCAGRLLLVEPSPDCAQCPRLVLVDASGAHEVHRFAAENDISNARCDRAGKQIVYSDNWHPLGTYQSGDLWVISTSGGRPRRLTRDARDSGGTFTPDGKSVIASSTRGGHHNLWEFPLDGGEPRQLTFGQGPDLAPDVSADGEQMLFNVDLTSVAVFAVPVSGAPVRKLTTGFEHHTAAWPTADGQQLVVGVERVGGADGDGAERWISVITLADGTERTLVEGLSPVPSPDGRGVAYVVFDDGHVWVDMIELTGGPARRIVDLGRGILRFESGGDGALHATLVGEHGGEAWRITITGEAPELEAPAPWCLVVPGPGGAWRYALKCGEERAYLFAAGEPLDVDGTRTIDVHRGVVAWDASGASLVHHDGTALRRYVIATGEDLLIAEHTPGIFAVTASPDGETLYTSDSVAHVRRQLITNFADRPWAR